MTAGYAKPDMLIETDELARRLGDPSLRVVDCTVKMGIKPDGGFDFISGVDDWAQAHIPGAAFIDLIEELSAPNTSLPFMMPDAERFARAVGKRGIANHNEVVVYATANSSYATRLFFMFRAMGHENVRVLNGGMDKWKQEQRPLSDQPSPHPPTEFMPNPRGRYFVGKADVLAAMDDPRTTLVCSLSRDVFSGEKNMYGRAGHIPGSLNVPATDLVDPATKRFLPADRLREKLAPTLGSERVVTYCGGGISATVGAFALLLLGHEETAIYDGSLLEWGADQSLPLQTGA